ncbi:MAG TPA: cytochrome c oxidase subunit 3 family protein [Clostridia bacterium]|nr:cytochrome c oxidase subunit 3 family protein [Clostridia bacterium]
MAESHTGLAEQFDDLSQQREAATLGMWTFLATEILFFGTMFLGYIIYRHSYPQAFAEASRHTLVGLGTVNTAILLTSSLTMALAVHSVRQGRQRPLVLFLGATVLFGVAFLVLKGFEYAEDLHQGLWPGPNFKPGLPPQAQIFWVLYWIMTGIHALHVGIGVGLLSVILWLSRCGKFSAAYHNPVEITGLYWHFVDVIWIFLYPLLYLIHRYS